MFVDREEELKALEEMYSLFLKGHLHGVIVYGLRKIGKTTLIRRFVANKGGIIIDLSWVNSVESLVKVISKNLGRRVEISFDDPVETVAEALCAIEEHARSKGVKIPVALDEFHTLLETLPLKLAKKYGLKRDEVFRDILWKLRAIVESSTSVFWIFVSSLGWMKLREYSAEREKARGALLGLLDRLEVKPLKLGHAKELALLLMKEPDEQIVEEIAMLSGGIPKIVEILVRRYNTTGESTVRLAVEAVRSGDFDDLFESMVRFLADVSKREADTLLQALKAVAEGCESADKVAEHMGTTRDSAYNILEELVKLGLLRREKLGKRVRYSLTYPLMRDWLLLRVQPARNVTELLARALGITGESYFRELLSQIIGKKIELREDASGGFFYGTAKVVSFDVKRVLSVAEMKKLQAKGLDADVVAEDEKLLVFEVKTRIDKLQAEDVVKFSEKLKAFEKIVEKEIVGVIVLLEGEPSPLAIAEAIKRSVVIMSPKAVRILAKKVDFPHW